MTSLLEDLAQSIADKTGKAIAIDPAGIRVKPKYSSKEAEGLDGFAKEQAKAMTVPYCYQCDTKLSEKMFELPSKCPGCGRETWMVKLKYN